MGRLGSHFGAVYRPPPGAVQKLLSPFATLTQGCNFGVGEYTFEMTKNVIPSRNVVEARNLRFLSRTAPSKLHDNLGVQLHNMPQ